MIRRRASRPSSERGASLVEFAMVFPLLIFLVMGIIDFGRYIAAWETVRSSAREGARLGTAVGDSANSIPHYVDCDEIIGAASAGGGVIDVTTSDVTVSYDDGPGTSVTATCPAGGPNPSESSIDSGDRIVVTVTSQLSLLTPFVSQFLGGSVTLTSTDRRTVFKQ